MEGFVSEFTNAAGFQYNAETSLTTATYASPMDDPRESAPIFKN
jgi:hypothetical protein